MTFAQQKIKSALTIANSIHQDEVYKHSGLPYICHIHDIIRLAYKIGIPTDDVETYCTIILHDTVESGLDIERVFERFGNDIGYNIGFLTYYPNLDGEKQTYMDRFANPGVPIVASVVKALDRLCNTKDFLAEGNEDYARKYFGQASLLFETVCYNRLTQVRQRFSNEIWGNLFQEYLDLSKTLNGVNQ